MLAAGWRQRFHRCGRRSQAHDRLNAHELDSTPPSAHGHPRNSGRRRARLDAQMLRVIVRPDRGALPELTGSSPATAATSDAVDRRRAVSKRVPRPSCAASRARGAPDRGVKIGSPRVEDRPPPRYRLITREEPHAFPPISARAYPNSTASARVGADTAATGEITASASLLRLRYRASPRGSVADPGRQAHWRAPRAPSGSHCHSWLSRDETDPRPCQSRHLCAIPGARALHRTAPAADDGLARHSIGKSLDLACVRRSPSDRSRLRRELWDRYNRVRATCSRARSHHAANARSRKSAASTAATANSSITFYLTSPYSERLLKRSRAIDRGQVCATTSPREPAMSYTMLAPRAGRFD